MNIDPKTGETAGIHDDEHHEIAIAEYCKKTLVAPSKVEYATFGVNHGKGCLHMCRYCYGCKEAKAHGRIECSEAWADLALVPNAAERVGRELDRKRTIVDRVHLSFMLDPMMWDAKRRRPVQAFVDSTLEVTHEINRRGIPVTLLTKGVYPELDLAALHPDNHYGITVVSLDEGFRREWEPGAPPVELRIEGLRRLADQGANTFLSLEPHGTPNIDPSAGDLRPLLDATGFIDKFIYGRMNYVTEVTDYLKTDADFYLRAARQVWSWCDSHGKALHIKSSTPLHRPETANILAADFRYVKGDAA